MKKIYFLLLFAGAFSSLSAQWTTNTQVNTEVSNSGGASSIDAHTMSTSTGGTWVAFYKSVPSPDYYEMRAQLLDKDGVKQLGPEGILVNDIPHASFTSVFSIAVDANDNLIVAFIATTSPNTLYIHKITPTGTQVWSSAGVSFTNAISPKLVVLNNNDIVVSWLSLSTGVAMMQRLAATDGSEVWANAVKVDPTIVTRPGNLYPLSDNGFIHVFHKQLGRFGINSNLFAQRYNDAGVAQWSSSVQLADVSSKWNIDFDGTQEADTIFIGFTGATGLHIDAYAQRINPDGTIPWGLNGSDFATNPAHYELSMFVDANPGTNSIWATATISDNTQGMQGAYVQKFNKQTGTRQLSDDSKALYPISNAPYVVALGISKFSDNDPVIMFGKYNSSISQFIYVSKLDANGNFVWSGDTIAMGTLPANKGRMDMTKVINDQAVTFWVENKNTDFLPYAQPIRIDGTTGLVPPVANFEATPTTVCRTSTVQYSSTSTGYITGYAWNFPGGTPSTSSDPNPIVTYNSNGVFDATLTVSNSSGDNSKTISSYITVNSVIPSVTLSGNMSACVGATTTFTVTGENLGSSPVYQWKINGTPISNSGNVLQYTQHASGSYQISCDVISTATCAIPPMVSTNTIDFNVYAYPKISMADIPVEVCRSDAAFLLNASPVGGVFSGNGIQGGNMFVPSSVANGSQAITYEITQNGCTSSMTKSILVNQCDERNLTIDQYPAIVLQGNPTHGPFSLRLNTDLYTTLTLKLFNNLGQLMKTQKATELTYGSVIPVDITNLPSGVYHLYIFSEENGGKTKSFSVIKQ